MVKLYLKSWHFFCFEEAIFHIDLETVSKMKWQPNEKIILFCNYGTANDMTKQELNQISVPYVKHIVTIGMLVEISQNINIKLIGDAQYAGFVSPQWQPSVFEFAARLLQDSVLYNQGVKCKLNSQHLE